MPAEERAVCERLRQFRLAIGFSQGGFANAVGMKPSLLSSYEHAQSRLLYRAAWNVFMAFPELSPEWLACGGLYPMLIVPAVDYPPPESCTYGQLASFLEVFEGSLTNRIHAARAAWNVKPEDPWPYFRFGPGPWGRIFAVASWSQVMREWLALVPDNLLNDFLNGLLHFGEAALKKLPAERREVIEQRRRELQRLALQGGLKRSVLAGKGQHKQENDLADTKDNLDNHSASATVAAMSSNVPTWLQLKKQIAKLTSERGAKAALADQLGVSRQVLGNWLSDDDQGAPNAALTLRLLKWVRDPKRQAN